MDSVGDAVDRAVNANKAALSEIAAHFRELGYSAEVYGQHVTAKQDGSDVLTLAVAAECCLIRYNTHHAHVCESHGVYPGSLHKADDLGLLLADLLRAGRAQDLEAAREAERAAIAHRKRLEAEIGQEVSS